MEDPQLGEVIGGYRLEKKIASGGMAVVYKARHATLHRSAAVKILSVKLARDPEVVSRFLNEARIANDLRHPCIVDIFDFVDIESPRRVACIMELLEAPTLAQVLRDGPLRIGQALNATLQLLDAIAAVHERGIIHRDLKPQNIIVVGGLETELLAVPSVKILDFGIAKISEAPTQHRTRTGSVMGTPAYMAPEQVAAAEVSTATDLYAIAEILFEMLAGRRVFEGDNLQILGQKMAKKPPEFHLPPTIYGHDRLLSLISTCLNPEPGRRPSLEDVEDAITDLSEEVFGAGSDDATILDQPAIQVSADPQMNTQMFFDRIAIDIADPPDATDNAPPPPPMAPASEDEGHLTLMRAPWSAPETAPPPRRATPPPRATSMPRIVVGRPAAQPSKKRMPLLLIAVLLIVVGLAGAAIWWVPRLGLTDGPTSNPLAEDITAWSQTHAGFTGRLDELLDEARRNIPYDEPARYDTALDALRKALVADPNHPSAIALYVECRSLRSPDALTRAEQDKLSRTLDFAEGVESPTDDTRRARAALHTAGGHFKEAVRAVQSSVSPAARLRAAEAQAMIDPRAALDILRDEGVANLPRAVLVRTRALRALGRYRSASDTIETRLTSASSTPEIVLERARIEVDLARDRTAKSLLGQAAEQSVAGRLALGEWLLEHNDPKAASTLQAIADDVTLNERLRLDAAVLEATRQIRAELDADTITTIAEQLGPDDPRVLRLRAEILLGAGRASDAKQHATKWLAVDPTAVGAQVVIATAASASGDPRAARKAIETAIVEQPRDPRLRLILGAMHLSMKDNTSAAAVIEALGELDPRLPAANVQLDPLPRGTWLEVEKHLLLARAEPELRTHAAIIEAITKFYTVAPSAAESALAEVDPKSTQLAVLAYRAQLALDRRSKDSLNRHVRAMSKIAPKAIAPNLYAARAATLRGQDSRAVGLYERLMVASDAPLLRVEHAIALFEADKKQGTGALRESAHLASAFPSLRRALYDAGL